ncbi:MAG: ABC transporter ATP-binding protein [Candidatus Marinimicrobia bacterium]|nr:ABC transporter ATP-binding protein [Candidatus Neomarinimicrobiota bacterium]
MNSQKVIETTDLSKKYSGNWAVSNLDITVRQGQIYGFLGPNGAGKSTTIRLIMRLVKPTRGSFKLFGQKTGLFRRQIYSRIGALIEEPQFYDFLTARQNLINLGNLVREISSERLNEILDIVNLQDAKHKKVEEYSHGMRKRLGIAQTLIHDPDLLIFDEPTSGLDPEGMRKIRNLLTVLVHDFDKTVFLSSHHLQEIESICTHMGIINYGKLVIEGSVDELLKNTDFFVTEVVVDKPQEALELLLNQKWINKISLENNKLKLHISGKKRPLLTRFLVEAGFQVYAVKPRTSIEDYYISLIRTVANEK